MFPGRQQAARDGHPHRGNPLVLVIVTNSFLKHEFVPLSKNPWAQRSGPGPGPSLMSRTQLE